MANPVGTGPYRLKEWRRGQKIVLEASPSYPRRALSRESSDPADKAIMAKLKGKRLPIVGRVEISIIEESNPRLLAFRGNELDYVSVPSDLVWNVLDPPATLKPALAKEGIVLGRGVLPAITYTYFNMEDPVVGGYTPEKIALRRAVGMAYNVPEEIKVIRQGQAFPANQVVPPDGERPQPQPADEDELQPGAGAGAARPLRLQGPRRRRLPRAARRQAAHAHALAPRPPRSSASSTSCGCAA